MRKRIVLVEDHPSFRDAVLGVLARSEVVEVVASVGRADAVWPAIRRHRPDLIVCDVHLPDMSGVDVCRQVCAAEGGPMVCMLSADLKRDTITATLTAGAIGYIHKGAPAGDILALIEQAATGVEAFDTATTSAYTRSFRPKRTAEIIGEISETDLALLRAIADGYRDTALEARLGRRSSEIDARVDELRAATGAATPAALVAWSLRERLIT